MTNKLRKKIGFRSATKIADDIYEATQKQMKIVEQYPIQCGLTVLHLSKVLMLEFIVFLHDSLKKHSFEFIYTGISIFNSERILTSIFNLFVYELIVVCKLIIMVFIRYRQSSNHIN
jgi:hypothetical protein